MSFGTRSKLLQMVVVAHLHPLFISRPGLHAQQAVLAGVVMDTAGRPLEAAEILTVRGKSRALSDVRGQFVLAGLRTGRELVQVRRVGYYAQVFELDIRGPDTLRVGVTLGRDSVQRLPEISVEAPPQPSPGEQLELEASERILLSGAPTSALISRSELATAVSGRLILVLVKHGMRAPVNRGQGERLGCPRSAGGGGPAIYVDGVRQPSDFSVDSFAPDQIELIEVYRSGIARPAQFSASRTGCTVLIWLRRR